MKQENKDSKKKRVLKLFLLIVLIVLALNVSINIVRILFVDRLSNVEIYQYSSDISIKYDNQERSSTGAYYVNTYLRNLFVHRIKKEDALNIIDNPKLVLNIDGYNFYLSDNDEIVFALHTQMIRKRSNLDKIFMILFYDKEDYLYYSTKPDEEHFENAMDWFRIFEREEGAVELTWIIIGDEQLEISDDFLFLINEEIDKVEINPEYAACEVDIQWLESELKSSQMAQTPDEIVALDLEVELFYKDTTSAILRLLNPKEGICSLRYGSVTYTFMSESIAEWLEGIGY